MTDETCSCGVKLSPTLARCAACGKEYGHTTSQVQKAEQREKRVMKLLMKVLIPCGFAAAFVLSGRLDTAGVPFGFRILMGIVGAAIGLDAAAWLRLAFRQLFNTKEIRLAIRRAERDRKMQYREGRLAEKQERNEQKEAVRREIQSGLLLKDFKNRPAIRFDQTAERLIFYSESGSVVKTCGPDDLISAEIIDDENTITSTNRGSQFAGALIGGALLGGAGAVVGGLSGAQSSVGRCERLALRVVFRDTRNPTHVVTLLERRDGWRRSGASYKYALQQAELWYGRIRAMIKKAESAAAPKTEANNSLVEELERIKKLHDQGDLNDREYDAAKAQILGR